MRGYKIEPDHKGAFTRLQHWIGGVPRRLGICGTCISDIFRRKGGFGQSDFVQIAALGVWECAVTPLKSCLAALRSFMVRTIFSLGSLFFFRASVELHDHVEASFSGSFFAVRHTYK